MFGDKALISIEKTVTLLGERFVIPLKWDKASSLITTNESVVQKRVTKIVFIHFLIHTTYCSIQLINLLKGSTEMDPGQLFILFLMWTGYPLCWITIVSLVDRRYQVVTFLQQMVSVCRNFENIKTRRGIPNKLSGDKTVIHFYRLNTAVAAIFFTVLTLVFIVDPTAPQYFYAMFPTKKESIWWIFPFTICLVEEMMSKFVNISTLMFYIGWFIVSVTFEQKCIKLIAISKEPVHEKINRYRSLYLLNHFHNQCYTPIYLPALLTFMATLALIGVCGSIRLYESVNLTEYLIMIECAATGNLFSFLLLYVSATVYKSSSDTLSKIIRDQSSTRSKVLRKRVTSLRPFGVRIGPVGAVSFNAVTGYFLTMSNCITSTLVGFPHR